MAHFVRTHDGDLINTAAIKRVWPTKRDGEWVDGLTGMDGITLGFIDRNGLVDMGQITPAAPGIEAVCMVVDDEGVTVTRSHVIAWRLGRGADPEPILSAGDGWDAVFIVLPDGQLYAPEEGVYASVDVAKAEILKRRLSEATA